MAGKGVALAAGKPFIAVNHLEAHALVARLVGAARVSLSAAARLGRPHPDPRRAAGVGQYERLGATMDDAIGEAFDKTAKMLGLPYPGGPAVEAAARGGDPTRFALPRPLLGRPNADFSLSGPEDRDAAGGASAIAPLKPRDVADLCASFQAAVVDVIEDRMRVGARALSPSAPARRRRSSSPAASRPRRDPRGDGALLRAGRRAADRAAAETLHRQRRDDRLGRASSGCGAASSTTSPPARGRAGRSTLRPSGR